MIYREFQGMKLSALGFGSMRLPVIDGDDSNIDKAEAEKMVAYAYENGVNYYDTAWGYHNGKSEVVMGEILSKYPRDSFYIADKFPGYDLDNMGKAKEIFAEQQKRTGMDYFDFYLVHNVCELNIDAYLDPKYPDVEYLIEQKKEGKIKHLGFSAHGSADTIKRFLDKYGAYMEFCQLQLNFLDWEFQDTEGKYKLLEKNNIPVWVMEPLRGGRLVRLSDAEAKGVAKIREGLTGLECSFRFIQSLPNVKVTLSGMSSLSQVKDNIEFFKEDKALNADETAALMAVAKGMTSSKTVPCTGCHYCVSHCPQELDIPKLLELYNEHHFSDGGFLAPFGLRAMGEGKQPSDCLSCGSCAAVCPQRIDIPGKLAEFAEMMKQ